ncbi:hypothetical protein MMC06_001673 [Schaereria dolodes]|nr:hypothetical protein [Schaereria dolodes]
MSVKTTATIASFGGKLLKLSHDALSTATPMAFNLYLPPHATVNPLHKVPVLIYLAGLTCSGDNGAEKGFFQYRASQKGIAVLYPDTSPRGLKIDGEDDSYDFGTGAGFYVDATKEPWKIGYNMYSYITEELPQAIFSEFKELDENRVSITGHSMGGHGALTLVCQLSSPICCHSRGEQDEDIKTYSDRPMSQYLKNPGKYRSVSAFAPVANPINCPWGQKAFKGYFGEEDMQRWKENDATELVKKYKGPLDLLIDVGTADNFYKQGQLLPENFARAAKESGNDKGLTIRYQDGYDHSYFFISSFATDHVNHAAKYLLG